MKAKGLEANPEEIEAVAELHEIPKRPEWRLSLTLKDPIWGPATGRGIPEPTEKDDQGRCCTRNPWRVDVGHSPGERRHCTQVKSRRWSSTDHSRNFRSHKLENKKMAIYLKATQRVMLHGKWKRAIARQLHNKQWRNNGTRHVTNESTATNVVVYAFRGGIYDMQQQRTCVKQCSLWVQRLYPENRNTSQSTYRVLSLHLACSWGRDPSEVIADSRPWQRRGGPYRC
jgi:hypothetical protein